MEFDYTAEYQQHIQERDDQQGSGGCRLERHNFAHFETALSSETESGHFIIGKYDEESGTMYLTAFIIPRGYTLYVPANTIHTNDYQRGLWRTYLEHGKDIDVCNLVGDHETNDDVKNIMLRLDEPIQPRLSGLDIDIALRFSDVHATFDEAKDDDELQNILGDDTLHNEYKTKVKLPTAGPKRRSKRLLNKSAVDMDMDDAPSRKRRKY